jgi:hypothetical protein
MVKYLDGDGEDEIVADGESVVCPLYLCDATQAAMIAKYGVFDARDHQPHFGHPSDAVLDARKQARDAYVRRTCEAWRTAARVQSKQDADPGEHDPNAANPVERELETWQGRDPAELARDVEARRRAVYAEFCNIKQRLAGRQMKGVTVPLPDAAEDVLEVLLWKGAA